MRRRYLQRPYLTGGHRVGVGAAPAGQPLRDLLVGELAELDDEAARRYPRAPGDQRARRDHRGHRCTLAVLGVLEVHDVAQVVASGTGGLDHLVEPVEDHHADDVVALVGEHVPADPAVGEVVERLLHLPPHLVVRGDVTQRYPHHGVPVDRQPGGEHLGEHGLPGAGIAEDQQRPAAADRRGEVRGEEGVQILVLRPAGPPLIVVDARVVAHHGVPVLRRHVSRPDRREAQPFDVAQHVGRGQRLGQRRLVGATEPFPLATGLRCRAGEQLQQRRQPGQALALRVERGAQVATDPAQCGTGGGLLAEHRPDEELRYLGGQLQVVRLVPAQCASGDVEGRLQIDAQVLPGRQPAKEVLAGQYHPVVVERQGCEVLLEAAGGRRDRHLGEAQGLHDLLGGPAGQQLHLFGTGQVEILVPLAELLP